MPDTREYDPTDPESVKPDFTLNEDGSVNQAGLVRFEDVAGGEKQDLAAGDKAPETEEEKAAALAAAGTKGEETEEEKAATAAEEERKRAAGPVEDKEIAVGGEKKKRSEWLAEMENAGNLDLSSVPVETQNFLLDNYIDSKNKEAWQKTLTHKSEEASHQRKAQEAVLARKEKELTEKHMQLRAREAEIARQIGDRRKMIEKPISREEVVDSEGRVDLDRQRQYFRQQDAAEELPRLQTELDTLKQESAQAEINRTLAALEVMQQQFPEYATAEPLPAAIARLEKDKDYSHPDTQRVLDILDIVDYSNRHAIPVDLALERLRAQGRLTVKGVEAGAPDKSLAKEVPTNRAREEVVRQIAENQRKGVRMIPAGGGGLSRPSLQQKTPLGDRLREASQRAMGASTSRELDDKGW